MFDCGLCAKQRAVSIGLEIGALDVELVQRLTLLTVLMRILIAHNGCCSGVLVVLLYCLLSKELYRDLSQNDIIIAAEP